MFSAHSLRPYNRVEPVVRMRAVNYFGNPGSPTRLHLSGTQAPRRKQGCTHRDRTAETISRWEHPEAPGRNPFSAALHSRLVLDLREARPSVTGLDPRPRARRLGHEYA
ncbi:hypothetical protein PsYK624_042200 [Phanerochaete sordida]|uniref:Uncharacterized protein n=1 Tax=Phanerochaete sordida TaxID=48140 RepID=A0A9P3LBS5_9APHY|nr:hypothetical protein PsYK624_042200 [Phanerochaete sordida]